MGVRGKRAFPLRSPAVPFLPDFGGQNVTPAGRAGGIATGAGVVWSGGGRWCVTWPPGGPKCSLVVVGAGARYYGRYIKKPPAFAEGRFRSFGGK